MTDASGRPIVAELGRAETPDETADRKAASRIARRRNQTTFNLVVALIASLLVGGIVIFTWVARPVESQLKPVDYKAAASDAQSSFDVQLAAPDLPEGWSANRAQVVPAGPDGIRTWQIGFLTPSEQYIGLVQGTDVNDTWIGLQTANHEATDRVMIGDIVWHEYDRRDVHDPGNLAYVLVGDFGSSTVVLGGTATDAEFTTLATAISEELAP